jgi:uroporphyrinogen-III synthase
MKIAITRLAGKELTDAVRCAAFGHECTTVSPLRAELDQDAIDAFVTAARRREFDCIFFSSALPARIIAPRLVNQPRVIAIGPQTAGVLNEAGIHCEVLPGYYSRDLVPYLGEWLRGKQIGIPRADVPNPELITAITNAGGIPREYRCYHLRPTGRELELSGADAILFTSASSFREARWKPRENLLLIAIGEITAGGMRDAGRPPLVTGDGSLEGTLAALNRYLAGTADRGPG